MPPFPDSPKMPPFPDSPKMPPFPDLPPFPDSPKMPSFSNFEKLPKLQFLNLPQIPGSEPMPPPFPDSMPSFNSQSQNESRAKSGQKTKKPASLRKKITSFPKTPQIERKTRPARRVREVDPKDFVVSNLLIFHCLPVSD
jgi:hypothetical protein